MKEPDFAKGMEGTSDTRGDISGVPGTAQCATARTIGRKETYYGSRGMEGVKSCSG